MRYGKAGWMMTGTRAALTLAVLLMVGIALSGCARKPATTAVQPPQQPAPVAAPAPAGPPSAPAVPTASAGTASTASAQEDDFSTAGLAPKAVLEKCLAACVARDYAAAGKYARGGAFAQIAGKPGNLIKYTIRAAESKSATKITFPASVVFSLMEGSPVGLSDENASYVLDKSAKGWKVESGSSF